MIREILSDNFTIINHSTIYVSIKIEECFSLMCSVIKFEESETLFISTMPQGTGDLKEYYTGLPTIYKLSPNQNY